MKNIAVIFGGASVEHDISVITAMQVFKNLKNFNVLPVYIKSNGEFVTADNLTSPQTFLNFSKYAKNVREVSFEFGKQNLVIFKRNKIVKREKIDCALLCNHGHGGEDGCLQGLLEIANIPYSSSNVLSSALCMDKVLTKIILKNAKISTPAYLHFDICEYKTKKLEILKNIRDKIKLPCIIKPANLGSSVGISICEDVATLEKMIDEALLYDNKIIVEEYIKNAREFCCAVLKIGDKLFTSEVQEVKKGKIYSFSDKYLTEKDAEKGEISTQLDKMIKKLSIQAYSALMCDGVVRVDFLFSEKQEKLYVNELNSIPGSLAFNLFKEPFADLIESLINEGINKNEKRAKLVYSFNSKAIESYINMTDHLKYKMC